VAADLGHTLLPEGTSWCGQPTCSESILARGAGDRGTADTGEVVAVSDTDAAVSLDALAPFARAESGLASRLQTLAGLGDRARVAQLFSRVVADGVRLVGRTAWAAAGA
jgi:hypothetical protein